MSLEGIVISGFLFLIIAQLEHMRRMFKQWHDERFPPKADEKKKDG